MDEKINFSIKFRNEKNDIFIFKFRIESENFH